MASWISVGSNWRSYYISNYASYYLWLIIKFISMTIIICWHIYVPIFGTGITILRCTKAHVLLEGVVYGSFKGKRMLWYVIFCYYANHYSNVHNIMSLHASFLNFCSHRILQAGFFILDCDVTSPVYVSSVGSAKCFSCLLKLHFPSLYHIILHIPSVLNEVWLVVSIILFCIHAIVWVFVIFDGCICRSS